MMLQRTVAVLFFASALAASSVAQPAPGAGASGSAALDVVVRDKKGAPVADLRPEEVELYEDGVRQTLQGVRRAGAPAAGGAGAAAEAARLVVFLFPKVQGIERDLARDAAEEFLKKQLTAGTSVAVLTVGAELVPIQAWSTDAAVLKQAVRQALEPTTRAGEPDVRSLYSLVLWLKGQPGRKTALLFAPGLIVPPGFEESVPAVVRLANQQRISFYGIDTRGLEISRGVVQADRASEGLSDQLWGMGGQSRVGADLQGHGQHFGGTFKGASPFALAQLANGTGGFVVERTNSFSKAMRQVAEDAAGYYELDYVPTAAKPSGQFRRYEVKVAREGARVQGRSETLVGETAATLVAKYETDLANALDGGKAASDVAVFERALHFGWDGKELAHVLWVAVPLEKVTLAEDAAAGRFDGDVSILARVKDSAGAVVASFSQRFPVAGPLDQLARARGATLPFVRRVKLAPGAYSLETAVQDGRGTKLTLRRTPLTVQAPQALVLSSLSLGDLVPAGASADAEDPLVVGSQRLVPNLGQPIKAGTAAMTLYSAIYPPAGSKEPAQMAISLLLGGQLANNATAPLPAPDATGKIAYATALKMDVLPPGDYRFKVAVTQGASRAEESLSFTIVP